MESAAITFDAILEDAIAEKRDFEAKEMRALQVRQATAKQFENDCRTFLFNKKYSIRNVSSTDSSFVFHFDKSYPPVNVRYAVEVFEENSFKVRVNDSAPAVIGRRGAVMLLLEAARLI